MQSYFADSATATGTFPETPGTPSFIHWSLCTLSGTPYWHTQFFANTPVHIVARWLRIPYDSAHFVKLYCTVSMYLFTFWDVAKGPTISILCIGFPDRIGCSFVVLAPTNTWHISDNCFSTYTLLLPNQKGLQNLAFTFLEDFIILKWPPAGPS